MATAPPISAANDAAAAPSTTISHVIFDMDGLLLDTEPFYTVVQERILERFGKVFDWSLKAKLMGKKAIESARIFVEECGLVGMLTPEEFLEEREGMLQELFPPAPSCPVSFPFPIRVERLVTHLHKNGIPMCVATGSLFKACMLSPKGTNSFKLILFDCIKINCRDHPFCSLFYTFRSYKRHFELKTQNHGKIFAMMHHVVMGDDPEVKKGKPSPDIFLAALKRFEDNVDPSKVLVFEDAPSGVAAAKNAGMSVVMIPDPRLDASYHKDADQVLSSLLDFRPGDWGLPPYED
uniref:glycerol-1-phosphatase n=1 Tax=Ananas comosus var. bracteatus TaxID=296719 RepID=A0A6V7PMW0_ANACO|nr:unnamed protein product [Ananas comosus var. bracteatus]